MAAMEPIYLGSLAVVSGIGLLFTVAGYALARPLLAWVGWLSGGAAGGGLAWVLAPQVTSQALQTNYRLGIAAAGVLAGAILGRMLIAIVGRFAVSAAGALATGTAALVFLTGDAIFNVIGSVQSSGRPLAEQPVAIVEELQQLSQFQQDPVQLAAIVGGAALIGGILAIRFYRPLIAVALTLVGAAIISIVAPMWQQVAAGQQPALQDPTGASPLVFLAAFAVGIVVQYFRHSKLGSSSD